MTDKDEISRLRSKLGLAVKALEEAADGILAQTRETMIGDFEDIEAHIRSTLALIGKEDFSPSQDCDQASGGVTSPGSEGAKP